MSRSMPPLTVSSAVESRRLTLRHKNRYPRCVLQAVEGVLLRSIDCGPRTALEPMVELVSRVSKRRIRRPLHAAVLVLRVACRSLRVLVCGRSVAFLEASVQHTYYAKPDAKGPASNLEGAPENGDRTRDLSRGTAARRPCMEASCSDHAIALVRGAGERPRLEGMHS